MTRLILASVHAAFVVSAIAGCTVGPDFNRPTPPKVSGYTVEALAAQTASAQVPGGETQTFALGRDISQQWWTLFRCPELNALVDRALKANPDMQGAQAALRQAMELVELGRAFTIRPYRPASPPAASKTLSVLSPRH